MMAGDLVVFVAMHQQEAASVGGLVDVVVFHPDVAEGGAAVFAQGLVMVAGHKDHLRALARTPKHFLNHRVLGAGPVNAAAHRPEVDDVAHQEQILRFMVTKKIQQPLRLATAGAQVDIGQKDRANLLLLHVRPVTMKIADKRRAAV
ncbi:hypothetical protein SDC9_165429 [bioreactor metagenome]|uniref:Uncharacterized protein n=1 Tax=bioreactor metagenome TaxID=1076179 RepID=A0A645FUA8_9ZZZZ